MVHYHDMKRDDFIALCRKRREDGNITILRMPKHIRLEKSGELRHAVLMHYWCDESIDVTATYHEYAVADAQGNVDMDGTIQAVLQSEAIPWRRKVRSGSL